MELDVHEKILFSSKLLNIFVVLYLIGKHTKLKTLITILALYQLQTKNQMVDALASERNKNRKGIICACKLEWWTIHMQSVSMLGIIIFLYMNAKKVSIYKGMYTPMLTV